MWCNNYINSVDKSVKVVNEDLLRWHAVFYSVCQALFYIVSFRHQDLMDNKRSKFFFFFRNGNMNSIFINMLAPDNVLYIPIPIPNNIIYSTN